MIDSLFQSVPPEDFFRHRDFRPLVIEAVRGNEKPYIALLASPEEWDVASHPILPLYAAYKTNSRDNQDMPPPQWQLIFTAPGREEMVILPWDENDKTPPSAVEQPVLPPGATPKVTFSFDQAWRDVGFDRLAAAPKSWKVVLHAGSFLSNPVGLRIKHAKPEPPVHPGPAVHKPATAYPEMLRAQFAHTPLHPAAPAVQGVAFAKQLGLGTSDHPALKLLGSFAFPVPAPEAENLVLHLFLTADDIPNGIRISMAIPKALGHEDGKLLKGDFTVDLRPYFTNSSGMLLTPHALFVTPIRGEYIGEPHRIELPHPK
jgi:hypothetical protein